MKSEFLTENVLVSNTICQNSKCGKYKRDFHHILNTNVKR